MVQRLDRLLVAVVVAAAGALMARPAAAQQSASVTGVVVDAATLRPVSGANVYVPNTSIGMVTNNSGQFMLLNVPAGEVTIRVERIGYEAQEQVITVTAGVTPAALRFELSETAFALDAIVVDALTGEAVQQRQLAHAVARVSADEIAEAPIKDVMGALTGRMPGVVVRSATGTTGTGAAIRIRGANSLSLSNEPLIIVDGARYSNSSSVGAIWQEGGQPSRLNDLNPAEIESIEVLKGPAASGLYGTAAANGVIVITTKKGLSGAAPRISGYLEMASLKDVSEGLPNFAAARRNEAGQLVPSGCLLLEAAAGECTQETIASFNVLKDPRTTPYRDGNRQRFGLSIAGGADQLTYYVSADRDDEAGVFETSASERTSLRLNAQLPLHETLNLSLASNYLASDLELPSNSWSSYGYTYNALGGRAFYDESDPTRIYNRYAPEQTEQFEGVQQIRRYTASANADWRPLTWLTGNATIGMDATTHNNVMHIPPGVLVGSASAGSRESDRGTHSIMTGNAALTSNFALTDRLGSTTTIGFDYQREVAENAYAGADGVLEGTESLSATSSEFRVAEGRREVITLGWFVQQRLSLSDRLFLTLGLRGDDNSAFGNDFGLVTYPSAGASWVVSEESFFPTIPHLSSLRLRTSYGRSGLRPGFRQAITYYTPVHYVLDGSTRNTVTIGGTGNPELAPEKVDEFELGADLNLFSDRLAIIGTYFRKTSTDALIARRLPPSLGLSAFRFDNLGEVQNSGLELGVQGRLIQREALEWDATLSMNTLDNRINDLGEGIPAIIFHQDGVQRHEEGYSAGSWWDRPITYDDANGDGVLSVDEVEVGEEAVFLGNSLPTLTANLSSSVKLFGLVTISGLLERRSGHMQYNRTERFRCQQGLSASDRGCQGMWDPAATLAQQAAFIGYYTASTNAGFLEDASFVKLREMRIAIDAPRSLIDRMGIGVESLQLAISGRNLKTWTDYTGTDVEGNVQFGDVGNEHINFPTGDMLGQPPLRYWTVRLNFQF